MSHARRAVFVAALLLPAAARAQPADSSSVVPGPSPWTVRQDGQGLPDAAGLLDKSVQASFGDKTLEGALVMRGRCRFSLKGREDPSPWGKFEEWIAADGRSRAVSDYPGFGKFEHGSSPDLAWEIDPTVGPRVMRGKSAEDLHRRIAAWEVGRPWRDYYAKAETIGQKDVGGRPHWILRLTGKNGTTEKVWIDKETHARTRFDGQLSTPMGDEDFSFHLRDSRRVDGIRYAFKRRMEMGFLVLEFECESVEHVGEVPAAPFALPDAVKDKLATLEKTPASGGETAITLRQHEQQHAVAVRLVVKEAEIGAKLGIVFPEVIAYLNARDVRPSGPPYTRWFKKAGGKNNDEYELEAGFPVAAKTTGKGRIEAVTIPAARVAESTHIGPYEELDRTWTRIESWMAEKKLELDGAPWELYLTDPGLEPDASKWRTRCVFPVKPIIRIQQLDERHTAKIRVKIKPAEISRTLAVLLPEVLIHVAQLGIELKDTDAPYCRHYSFKDEFDLEAGVPVPKPIAKAGRIEPGKLPACKAVMIWHVGPYQELGRTFKYLGAWMKKNGLEPGGAPWEFYLTDPRSEPDASKWLTQVFWPIKE